MKVEEQELAGAEMGGEVKEELEWEFDQAEFVCAEMIMKSMAGVYVPHMKVQSNYGDWVYVPLFGQVNWQLSEYHCCSYCFTEYIDSRGKGLCEACLKKEAILSEDCQLRGCGVGEQDCMEVDPETYGQTAFVVYLGLYGGLILPGIACRMEVESRLLMKGVDVAVVFSKRGGILDLPMARGIYDKLRAEYNFPGDSFILKVQNLNVSGGRSIAMLQRLGAEIMPRYGLQFQACYELWRNYFNKPKQPRVFTANQGWVTGEIVGSKGNVLFFRQGAREYVLDAEDLIGYKLLNVRG